ncbi:MAG: alanyl-tRNA synthetase AlaRS, alanyl-tRNA synthetase, partial [Candidatus Levybacteria bacterium]|nr:alanyl-tRNA synthetase AlaRS, alanyl-tRNA synthetase [Candidatus Levybacteria bacterium]
MTALKIIEKYIDFFEKRGHKRIPNAPLVPQNDPTTLFTSSGMQPLVPYLLGEAHPMGKKLVNVQNSFRAVDIEEVGDNRHTTFFRMLGNWSLGDYFKKEQLPWIWEFVTRELGIPANKLYVTVFKGYKSIPKDTESEKIWTEILTKEGLNSKERIFFYDTQNWWSRAGEPDKMPAGEPGGPDSEIFFDFGTPHTTEYGRECHPNCRCGRFLEIVNSVFMEYSSFASTFVKTSADKKGTDGRSKNTFIKLPQRNVDHGAGVERLLAAVENKQDIFQTSLFAPIINLIKSNTKKNYQDNLKEMRIIADHLAGSIFIIAAGTTPSNKDHGYILRRLIRRVLDNFYKLGGTNISPVLEKIVEQYGKTDNYLMEKFENIKNTVLEEEQKYKNTLANAKEFILKKYKTGDELKGVTEISSEDAFILYSTHGLSPTQIKSLGYAFNDQEFAEKMKAHQALSKKGAEQKFKGGLADHSEATIMGHTATHLLHKALRDLLGNHVHQTGSNITSERVRFDFSFDRNLTPDELKKIENTVNEKIKENLPVHFEMLTLAKAKEIGAIGLFDEKYGQTVKVYFVGDYSVEFCGGPHVAFTSKIKSFRIIKQENIGKGNRRIYAKVDSN